MAKVKTININFKCAECGTLEYSTKKNPTENKEKLELKKHCSTCRKHTAHKENKISKAKK